MILADSVLCIAADVLSLTLCAADSSLWYCAAVPCVLLVFFYHYWAVHCQTTGLVEHAQV